MSEQMRKLRQEIERTLREEKAGVPSGVSKQIDANIEGWIEALEYVLGQIDESEKYVLGLIEVGEEE